MHKKGDPKIMQESPNYTDVVSEVYVYLESRSQLFINKGVKNIVIDPGFGFSKNIQHNFELLKHMDRIKKLPYPILVGISRKSMIYKTLQISAEESLNATTVLHTFSLLNGAHILRVHDVLEAKQAITLTELLQ
jgi:dihydropteroate synthase